MLNPVLDPTHPNPTALWYSNTNESTSKAYKQGRRHQEYVESFFKPVVN